MLRVYSCLACHKYILNEELKMTSDTIHCMVCQQAVCANHVNRYSNYFVDSSGNWICQICEAGEHNQKIIQEIR